MVQKCQQMLDSSRTISYIFVLPWYHFLRSKMSELWRSHFLTFLPSPSHKFSDIFALDPFVTSPSLNKDRPLAPSVEPYSWQNSEWNIFPWSNSNHHCINLGNNSRWGYVLFWCLHFGIPFWCWYNNSSCSVTCNHCWTHWRKYKYICFCLWCYEFNRYFGAKLKLEENPGKLIQIFFHYFSLPVDGSDRFLESSS